MPEMFYTTFDWYHWNKARTWTMKRAGLAPGGPTAGFGHVEGLLSTK